MIEYWKNLSLENLFYIDENGIVQEEEWRDIPDYIGYYKCSNLARIKSVFRYRIGNLGVKTIVNERIMKQSIDDVYCRVGLRKNNRANKEYVHIIVAKTFIPNPENKPEVNHLKKTSCGLRMNTLDNRPESLVWSTRSENMKYGYEFGFKSAKGSNNGKSKLTEEQVLEMRAIGKYRNYTKDFSIKYGVSEKYISAIMNNDCWNHV